MEQPPDLDRLYEEAQAALTAEDFRRAGDLLKRILIFDETYKDASRLLAQMVARKRRRWYSDWRLWGGLLAAGAIGVGVLALPYFLSPRTPARITQAAASGTTGPSGSAAVSTPALAPAATSYPGVETLVWVRISVGQEFSRATVTAIAADPNDPDVLYVGTQGAGVYKSIDGGISWQPASNGLGSAEIRSLVIDPQEPTTLYAGNLWAGLYKTTDGAAAWQASFPQPGSYVGLVAMDPEDSQHLIYLTGNRPVVTYDGGATWSGVALGCGVGHGALTFNPNTGSELYLSQAWSLQVDSSWCDEGIYRSTDGGKTWALAWLQGVQDIQALAYGKGPQGEELIFASTNSELLLSRDGGATWDSEPFSCASALLVDLDNPSTAYCGAWGLMRTLDGGISWESVPWLSTEPIRSVAVADGTAPRLFVGSSGLQVSTDNGATWSERSNGLGSVQTDLALDPGDPSLLYAASLIADYGRCHLFRSNDIGETWEPVDALGGCGPVFDSEGLLYSHGEGRVGRSRDRGETWEAMDITLPLFRLEANPVLAGMLYLVPGIREHPYLYWSEDSGETWQGSQGMTENDGPHLYFAGEDGKLLYAVGGKTAYRSEDAGKTWAACGEQGRSYALSDTRLAIDPRDSNRLLIGAHGDGVLISEDGCQTWTQSNEGLGNTIVDTLAIDPQNPDTVYAGTDSGAYISFNGGQTWGLINDGLLGATVVYSIVVDPQSNVYASTPYGIFKLGAR